MKTILAILFLAMTATAQTNFFPKLLNDDGGVLLTNAEFRSIVGRKMIFKQRGTGKLKAFDIVEVSAKTRDQLNISTAKAIAEQKEIDSENAKAARIRAEQVAIAAERQRIRMAELAKIREAQQKQAAIAAENQKLEAMRQLEMNQKQADIDATRAEAARARAAAEYLNRTP